MKKTKRNISLGLVAAIIASSAASYAETFKDMPNDWSKAALIKASEDQLLKGDGGYIYPNNRLKRSEISAILNRLLGSKETANISNYKDVKPGKWYYEDMQKIVKLGILKGDGENLKPEDDITREEVFVILVRLLNLEEVQGATGFKDNDQISNWAKGSINALKDLGIMKGYEDNTIRPKNYIKRSEFASLLSNMYGRIISKPESISGTIEGNVFVNSGDVDFKSALIKGDLIIGEGADIGEIKLLDSQVTGRIIKRSDIRLYLESTEVGAILILDSVEENIEINNIKLQGEELKSKEDLKYKDLLNKKEGSSSGSSGGGRPVGGGNREKEDEEKEDKNKEVNKDKDKDESKDPTGKDDYNKGEDDKEDNIKEIEAAKKELDRMAELLSGEKFNFEDTDKFMNDISSYIEKNIDDKYKVIAIKIVEKTGDGKANIVLKILEEDFRIEKLMEVKIK